MITEDYLFIKFCKDKDEGSLKELIGMVNPWLHSIVFRIVADDDLADDIQQETWIKIISSCKNFNPEKGTFNNYIFKIARNKALKELEKINIRRDRNKRSNEYYGNDGTQDRQCPEFMYSFNECSAALLKAISCLDENYRNVIELHFFGGFEYGKISKILDKPKGTISSQIRRGKEELEKILPDYIRIDYLMDANE